MSVIITKSASQALTTVNGFYRVEAHNLGCLLTAYLAVNTARTIPVTFANAGNCQGVVLGITPSVTSINRTLVVKLQENVAGTWTDRVTENRTVAQVFGTERRVGVSENGSVLVNIDFASPYAVDTTASKWRFEVSQTGGTAGNFNLLQSVANSPFYATWCDTSITFTTDDTVIARSGQYVTIDTTATFKGVAVTGDATYSVAAIACINLVATSTADLALFVWENPATASYTLTINGYFFLSQMSGFRAGTSAAPIAYAQKANILTVRAPTIGTAGNSGFRRVLSTGRASLFFYGEAPDFADTHADLAYLTMMDTTFTVTIANPAVFSNAVNHGILVGEPVPIRLSTTGALPTGLSTGVTYWATRVSTSTFHLYDSYANALALGATGRIVTSGTQSGVHTARNCITTVNPTGWAVGDVVVMGLYKTAGAATDLPERTITWISGNEMTLSAGLSHSNHKVGAEGIVNLSGGYGINLLSSGGSVLVPLSHSANLVCEGVRMQEYTMSGGNAGGTALVSSNFRQALTFKNCSLWSGIFFNACASNENGLVFENVNIFYGRVIGTHFSSTSSAIGVNGPTSFNNCYVYSSTGTHTPSTTGPITVSNYKSFNSGSTHWTLSSKGGSFTNCYYYGTNTNTGVYRLIAPVGVTFTNQTYERCTSCVVFVTLAINCLFDNDTYGTGAELANTSEYDFVTDATLINCEVRSPNAIPVVTTTNIPLLNNISRLAITDNNNVSNADSDYLPFGYFVRTGTGLGDTTVKTAGGFAIRFESISSEDSLEWTQDIPTGNIQNKDMTVAVWCKINNANYYSGTHQKPRLTIVYDNGASTCYAEATATTDWQLLSVTFTPTTTFGQISATLSTKTDQTSTNAYVYFDDYSVLYPAGTSLSLGSLDLWSAGLPVSPTISTLASAQDVWTVPTSTLTASGTIGKQVGDIKKDTGLIGALL